jgi:diguanylate cyclase (GGDEF)-like protein
MSRLKCLLLGALILTVSLCVLGCRQKSVETASPDSVNKYQDIPGVTKEEIAAIEAVKTSRTSLSYGAIFGTELFVLPDGSYTGFAKEFCGFLSDFFEIDFVPKMFEWNELMKGLESNTLDFTGELTVTEERLMMKYEMSLPIAERLLRIFTPGDSDRIKTESDVDGLTLGFMENSVTADAIKRAYPSISFTRKYADNHTEAARMVISGEIDAFVCHAAADPAIGEYDSIRSKIFFPMVHVPVSMTTANPELAPFISVLNKYILEEGFGRQDALYKEGEFEYTKYKLQKSFTELERDYIDDLKRQGKTVTVAFENDNYPVSFFNEKEGQFQGIVPDLLAEISGLTGIQFEAAAAKDATWGEIYEKVKSGEIQMVSQLLYSEARKENFIWSTVPYASSYYIVMSKLDFPNIPNYQIPRNTVGVLERSAYEDLYYELFPNCDNLRKYDTREKSLKALENGEINLLLSSQYYLLTQIHYYENPGYKINIRLDVPMFSSFGFHKDETTLRSIVDKAQQYAQTDAIETSWTIRLFDYTKKLAMDRAFFLTVFVSILSVMLIITIILLIRNIRLGIQLKEIASHDVLTGILNRRYFMETGSIQIDRSMRLGKECYVMIYDLDHFKIVNDTHGHQAGDKVLREIAQRVKKTIRPYDLFGRYGGEEFILLMFDIEKDSVLLAAERIRQDVCKTPVIFEDVEIPVSVSIGVAYAAPANEMYTAIKYADEALYDAKNGGRNRIVFNDRKGG